MSEAEKAQKYGETLFKLQHSLEKTKKPSSIDSPQPTDQPPSAVALHNQILQSVPKTMQRKAELLLGMIKNNNLTWDEQGVVSYKGKRRLSTRSSKKYRSFNRNIFLKKYEFLAHLE